MPVLFNYTGDFVDAVHTRDSNPNPGHFPMHTHVDHELLYFMSGNGTQYVEANPYHVYPGCILVMRAGESHHLKINPELPYERMVINFSPELFGDIDPRRQLIDAFVNRPAGQHNLYEPDMLNMELVHSCMRALSIQGRMMSNRQKALLTISCLCPVLFDIYRCFTSGNTKLLLPREGNTDVVNQVVKYINTHLCDEFTLDTLTEHFFISKTHLNNQFKQVTGSTVWEYTVVKRLFLARQYIRDGMSATEAAAASGWNDYSTFYRSYKAHFKISPKCDRQNFNKGNYKPD